MEDALRVPLSVRGGQLQQVLILVLMEDALRGGLLTYKLTNQHMS